MLARELIKVCRFHGDSVLKVLLLATLPEEHRYLTKHTGQWRRASRRPYAVFRCSFADKGVTLVETGMGRESFVKALGWATKETLPDIIVSFGFGGSLAEDFAVGLVAMGGGFLHWGRDEGPATREEIRNWFSGGVMLNFCQARNVPIAQIVTVDRPQPKRRLSRYFEGIPSIMDMESYFVARFARENGVPFFCFRAISDGLRHEIEFDLEEITTDGRVRIPKVLALLARKPALLKAFYKSWKRSMRAGQELAKILSALLDMPATEMEQIIREYHSKNANEITMNRS